MYTKIQILTNEVWNTQSPNFALYYPTCMR